MKRLPTRPHETPHDVFWAWWPNRSTPPLLDLFTGWHRLVCWPDKEKP